MVKNSFISKRTRIIGMILVVFVFIILFLFIYLTSKFPPSSVEQNSDDFEIKFFVTDLNKYIDGEVLIYGKSLGLTKESGLIVPKKELEGVSHIFFKTEYNGAIVILPFTFYKEDLDKKGVKYDTVYLYGIVYTTSSAELAENRFNISEKDILNNSINN